MTGAHFSLIRIQISPDTAPPNFSPSIPALKEEAGRPAHTAPISSPPAVPLSKKFDAEEPPNLVGWTFLFIFATSPFPWMSIFTFILRLEFPSGSRGQKRGQFRNASLFCAAPKWGEDEKNGRVLLGACAVSELFCAMSDVKLHCGERGWSKEGHRILSA